MRTIPDEMAARIDSGAATLCHAWLVRRRDGARLGFTDHDRDLSVDGVTCRAASGWTAGAAEVEAWTGAGSGAGSGAGLAAVSGALDDDAIREADVAAGLYDGARVDLWRVDWRRPDLKIRLWTARIARLRREGAAFEAELEGPMALLDRVAGRTYGRTCDAVLGDARCGVDRGAYAGRACDKRWRTCVEVFGNGINFQGFPDIPGDDFLTIHPGGAGGHDGGSRR